MEVNQVKGNFSPQKALNIAVSVTMTEQGMTCRQIAQRLGVQTVTVERYLSTQGVSRVAVNYKKPHSIAPKIKDVEDYLRRCFSHMGRDYSSNNVKLKGAP